MFVSDSPQNNPQFNNQDYDNYIATALKTVNEEKRHELYKKAETILLDEAPIIPIYTYSEAYLLHTDVKGWYPTTMDLHPLKEVYLERSK